MAVTVKQFKKRAKMHLLLKQVRQSGMLVRNEHNEFRSGFVDDLALITDVDANMDAFLNASDILRARDFYNREDHVELLDHVQHFPEGFDLSCFGIAQTKLVGGQPLGRLLNTETSGLSSLAGSAMLAG